MRTEKIVVGARDYVLAQGTDIRSLKESVARALEKGGGLVDFVVVGERSISALVSAGVPIVFESYEVSTAQPYGTGDSAPPFFEEYLL